MQGVLITAYKDVEQTMTLLDTLYGEFKIFLHIDAKSKELDEGIIRNKFPSLYVIKKYNICWGGGGKSFKSYIGSSLNRSARQRNYIFSHYLWPRLSSEKYESFPCEVRWDRQNIYDLHW